MKISEKVHFWQGEWIDDARLGERIDEIGSIVTRVLEKPLETAVVLAAADRLASRLLEKSGGSGLRARLKECLASAEVGTEEEIDQALRDVAGVLKRESLEKKLERELGSRDPFVISRRLYDDAVFEGWASLGLLVHVSPQNSFAVGPMSVLEGLLAGNINFLKTGGNESLFSQHFLEALVDADRTGSLRDFIIAARISSKNTGALSRVFGAADGIAAWGGEESIQSIRQMAPSHVRIVEWGHRISFAYLTRDFFSNETMLKDLARECCNLEQQACSSPQCIYLDTSDWAEVEKFAEALADTMDQISGKVSRTIPGDAEAAEITMVTECQKLESCFGSARVIESKKGEWRIFVDRREALMASPLYRSVWVKPLPREHVLATLRPMRNYLQTAGLACGLSDLSQLSRLLLGSGVTRIRRIGEMLGGYSGEPHDGVYALQRYSRRVAVQTPGAADGISTFEELRTLPPLVSNPPLPVTPKEAFAAVEFNAQLYFKSGGSSGEPKLSTFSYDQYDDQMWLGAEGLYAAGLDPHRDRAINLFFCGGLYGGFISIFSALERLRIVQFPMAAHPDLEMVTQTILKNKINVLLGMPSYILELFEKNAAAFENYHGVDKIFYGGEHFTESQRRYLTDRFSIRTIRSGAYGSVDIGPMGYQCGHCGEGVHHLQQRLHFLEILKMEEDAPVTGEEVGRLVFSPRSEDLSKPMRYAIGDVGHWIVESSGLCPCGRAAPRFKLLGRTGDIFRIGSMFLNFQKFQKLLSDAGYSGELQIRLLEEGLKEKVLLRISDTGGLSAQECSRLCLEQYGDLNEAVVKDHVLAFETEVVHAEKYDRSKASGKLLRVIDERKRSRTGGSLT